MESSPTLCLVLVTWPADQEVEAFARRIVADQLAACVAVAGPVASFYRWEGRVDRADECQLIIKTTRGQVAALEAHLRAVHPYELPEFLIIEAEASDAYASWMRASVVVGGD